MTDRVNGLTIVLTKDIRTDDVQCIIDAISMIKGVLKVEKHIVDSDTYFILSRYNAKMREKIFKLFEGIQEEGI